MLVAYFGLRARQRELRGRNCQEFQLCFLVVFELVSWNYQMNFSNQAVNGLFLIKRLTKMTFGLVPCIESLNNRSFWSTASNFFSRETPNTLQNLPPTLITVSIYKLSLVTSCLLNRFWAGAFQSFQWKPNWPKLPKVKRTGSTDYNNDKVRPIHTRFTSLQPFQFMFRGIYLSFFVITFAFDSAWSPNPFCA